MLAGGDSKSPNDFSRSNKLSGDSKDEISSLAKSGQRVTVSWRLNSHADNTTLALPQIICNPFPPWLRFELVQVMQNFTGGTTPAKQRFAASSGKDVWYNYVQTHSTYTVFLACYRPPLFQQLGKQRVRARHTRLFLCLVDMVVCEKMWAA
jgi:hypothetical protein